MANRTTIEVDAETRDRLRRFKSLDGLTYDEALGELLDAYPWPDPAGDPDARREGAQRPQEGGARGVADLDIPGQGETLQRRREAIAAVIERIDELGHATKAELLEIVDAEAMEYGSVESAWANCIRPALGAFGGVEATGPSGAWVPTSG